MLGEYLEFSLYVYNEYVVDFIGFVLIIFIV